ncbi:MAG TPA: phosphopantothenoylcysteine decarboxylase [Gemmataceae bacterium]|jgi:phosphopantothenate-cysteine ligase/phosphopantothenoylcysteine decarboxylase/phosphopantothenate--cysteine ligase|nr:phosphopantothenoylcysteine decarboxylase [Gemmataceae bacterium]
MNILVTAGNTQTPVDRVRCITNVFTGRTGTGIALEAHRRGHAVTLLTSHPEVVRDLAQAFNADTRWIIRRYRTFDDLHHAMAELVRGNQFDGLIHAAAVSDYHLAGTYAPVTGAHFDPMTAAWTNGKLVDVSAGKVKSHHPELWLRLTPTPKLADMVRTTWAFRGRFVKFKLEVGVTDVELKGLAQRSRAQSDADLMVANTLEGKNRLAWIGDRNNGWEQVERSHLAERLVQRVEAT